MPTNPTHSIHRPLLTLAAGAALLLSVALVGCGDDDGHAAVCGNGVIESGEQCDMDQLDARTCADEGFVGGTLACAADCTYDTSACTTTTGCGNDVIEDQEQCDGSDLGNQTCADVGNYTGGTLVCAGDCTFDTSACTARPGCGDGIIDTGEDCDDQNLNGQTCADVGNYTGGTLACATDCTFDTSACTLNPNCGNGALDAGEDCDGANLNSQTCTDVGNYIGGTLACATDCTFDTSACTLSTSGQIDQVIQAADATGLALPVEGAWVTYVAPAVGSDPAGFFLQSELLGPALFVAVDPATLSPVPVVGDEVDITVLEKQTVAGMAQATALASYAQVSQGHDVSSLIQDVTDASDLVSNLDDYTAELITATVSITGAFGNAGAGHQAAVVETTGVTGDPHLKLRVPSPVVAALGLDVGCSVVVTSTPLWRFANTAQISAWTAGEITVQSCAAPQVVSALATATDTVVVTFNRGLTSSSVLTDGSQFTIVDASSASLAVTAAAVTATNEVTLTTASQVGAAQYTVTVAPTVLDAYGVGVDPSFNTADFTGFEPFGAQLYLWEVDADQAGADSAEFLEIWNNSGAPMDLTGTFVLLVNGSDDKSYDVYALSGTLAADAVYTLGNVPGADQALGGSLQNGVDGVLLVECSGCAVSDFPNDTDPTTGATFTAGGNTVTKLDGVCYDKNNGDDPGLRDVLGVSTCFSEGAGAGGSTANALQRVTPSLWTSQPPTPAVK